MSALAHQQSIFIQSQRRLSEAELLRFIGSQTWNAADEQQALASIAAAVLRFPGLSGFRFEPAAGLIHLPIQETSKPGKLPSRASAISPVAANGRNWGLVRIFFEPNLTQKRESPLRLAKFIGQQLGILLHRLALLREHQRHQAHLEALARITRRRKIINRAASFLAVERSVSEKEAITLMVRYARRNRQNLLTIAESLIFTHKTMAVSVPPLHRRAAASAD